MTTFRPNINCRFKHKLTNEFDINGQPLFGCWYKAKCGVVKLTSGAEETSVRADSSATRGKAEERVAEARLMFRPIVPIAIGDLVDIKGYRLEVIDIQPRYDVQGDHHHNQVECMTWVERENEN